MIYFFSCLISILVSLGLTRYRKKQAKTEFSDGVLLVDRRRLTDFLIVLLSGFFPAIVSALRYGIGTDYFFTYYPWFQQINNGQATGSEYGFMILNRIVGLFTDNPQWIFVVTSFLFIYLVYYCIFKVSDNIQLSILLLYISFTYFVSLNNIRQSLASAIALIGLVYLCNGKIVKSIIWLAIACTIHVSMAPLFVLVLVYRLKIKSSILLTINLVLFVLRDFVTAVLVKILPLIGNGKFKNYYWSSDLRKYLDRSIGMTSVLINIFLMVLIILIEKGTEGPSNRFQRNEIAVCKYLQFAALLICNIDGIIPAAYRWLRIFTFPQFLFIPALISIFKRQENRRIITLCTIALYAVSFIQFVHSGIEAVFPYVSIFG
jgi:hypothetical protein